MTDSDDTPRREVAGEALQWLEARGTSVASFQKLAGDLSVRSYFRLRLGDGGSLVLALYPRPGDPACRRFERTDQLLRSVGVSTPEISISRCESGWMLLEDVGTETWYESHAGRSWTESEPFYRRAVHHVLAIETLDRSVVASLNPPLDAVALGRELELSWEIALAPEGLTGEGKVRRRLDRALRVLCERLEAEGMVPAHRDFMVRNLVISADRELVVLDHQDLRMAPRGYDLASLFNDSLFPSLERVMALVSRSGSCSENQYRRAVVQRCLKAVGSYRRAGREGRSLREPLVRPTLARAWEQFGHVPELADLRASLEPRWSSFLRQG